ncbi:MAG: hypothetical protein ACFB16_20345 [Phormidesmis sp.]
MWQEHMAQANQRLSEFGVRVRIYHEKGRLYLQGTFPAKPNSERTRPHQQRVALKLAANSRCVSVAEKEARKVGVQLESNTFDWTPYLRRRSLGTVASWVKRLEEEYFAAGGSRQTWENDYLQAFQKLSQEKQLSLRLLIATTKTVPANTKQRQRVCMAFARLAKFAELDPQRIVALRGRYSSKSVDPRSLPTDSLIQKWYNNIATPQWRWVFGMLATYGLRPHELFHCDLTDFPTVRVGRHTKTGDRFIWPFYPEWADKWRLHDPQLQSFEDIDSLPNTKLGTKVSRRFYVWQLQKQDGQSLRPYDLRHTFARRCFEFGFSPDFAAKMMGHSPELHSRIYRRWIDEGVYRKVYDAVIDSPERPHPPP